MSLLEEAYLEGDKIVASALVEGDSLLKRQLAFLYMIAYYQEDYYQYEGETFYIECFEALEIGGPTYLLEEEVVLRDEYPHEKVLSIAKTILLGKKLEKNKEIKNDTVLEELYQNALKIASN